MKLIAGLGNPGRKYDQTRHNVGFEVLGCLSRLCGAGGSRGKFQGEVREGVIGGEKVLLLAPHTFMNRSGTSIRQAVDFYRLELTDLLVICDDFQLSLGQLRIRGSGSDGGQKGLADAVAHLGDGFARLRIGIGPIPEGWDTVDFVLGRFASDERDVAEAVVTRAAEAAATWATDGLVAAMNQYNRKPSAE